MPLDTRLSALVPRMPGASARSFALLSIAAAVVTIGLKLLAWWLTGSVGLLSDALEGVINLAAALLAQAPPRLLRHRGRGPPVGAGSPAAVVRQRRLPQPADVLGGPARQAGPILPSERGVRQNVLVMGQFEVRACGWLGQRPSCFLSGALPQTPLSEQQGKKFSKSSLKRSHRQSLGCRRLQKRAASGHDCNGRNCRQALQKLLKRFGIKRTPPNR